MKYFMFISPGTVKHSSGLLIHFRPSAEVGQLPSVGCKATVGGVDYIGTALDVEGWVASRPDKTQAASELARIMREAGDFYSESKK